jgi:hypothetical protein
MTQCNRFFAWLPHKTTSGKVVWLTDYYIITKSTNVDPRHKWQVTTVHTEWEYFLLKLGGDFEVPHK